MRLRAVLRTFGVLLSGHILAKALALASAFLLGRSLGPNNLGVYGTGLTVLGYLMAASNFGQDANGIRRVSMEPGLASTLKRSVFQIRFALGVMASLVVLGIATWLKWPLSLAVALCTAALVYSVRADWLLLGMGRAPAVALASVIRELSFLLLVALILTRSPSLAIAALCFVGAEIVWSVLTQVLAIYPAGAVGKPARRVEILELLIEGWPIAIMSIMSLTYNKVDTPMLAASRGTKEAGLYYAAYTIMFAVMALPAVLSRAALPEMSRSHATKAPNQERPIEVLTLWAAVAGGALAVIIAGHAPLILSSAYGAAFSDGARALRVLAIILPLNFASVILLNRLVAVGNRKPLAIGTALAAGVNVLLLITLIPRWGMVGAAWATVGSESILLVAGAVAFSTRRVSAALTLQLGWIAGTAALVIEAFPSLQPLPPLLNAIAPLMVFAIAASPLLLRSTVPVRVASA